ncbi:MAG: molybdate ABC transporter substrate-binding protein [Myxococcota bacterium]
MTRATLVSAVLALAAVPARAAEPGLTVLAASSLTESLQQVGAAWTAAGHAPVTFSFDASSRLAKQLEAGAPADLYFSADREWMDHAASRGLIDPATRVDLLGNTLVVVVGASSPWTFTRVADLARPEVRHLAVAGESVPAGRYARAALGALGAWDAVEDRVVSGDNVRTTLGWVAAGEAEAGFVYATDARIEPRVKVAFPVPPDSYPAIVVTAAVVARSDQAAQAAAFLAFCRSDTGMAVFTAAGFTPAPHP